MQTQVALVTGANRGIGAEIARQLAAEGYFVWLGSREPGAAARIVEAIRAEGGRADAVKLDVTSQRDIDAAIDHIGRASGGLDALVNNAGIAAKGFDLEILRRTLATNFYGALHTTDRSLRILRRHGRVVMVSSNLGHRAILPAVHRARISAPDLSRAELLRFVSEYVEAVAAGHHAEAGWPSSAYRMSKIAMTTLAAVLSRELESDPRGLLINACCPGWVRTDMGGPGADRSLAVGADTPVWLATLPPDGPRGGFFRDRAPAEW
jgi:NAD(P)-dependent dehydrogenase (short-subunit alcohol dehydrogenase family)